MFLSGRFIKRLLRYTILLAILAIILTYGYTEQTSSKQISALKEQLNKFSQKDNRLDTSFNKETLLEDSQNLENEQNNIDKPNVDSINPKIKEIKRYKDDDTLNIKNEDNVIQKPDPIEKIPQKISILSDQNTARVILDSTYQQSTREEKLGAISHMMKFAWDGYKKYAWGWGALNPVSNSRTDGGPFGNSQSGATIIDSLDTLLIMGMESEYDDGVNWLVDNFEQNFINTSPQVSVFEVTIRYIGGFLAAYQQSGDKRLLNLAKITADKLSFAVETKSGLPWTLISPRHKSTSNYNWAPGNCGTLADVGTLHLEWKTLSRELGDPKYENIVNKIRETIKNNPLSLDKNLYPHFINTRSGNPCTSKVGLGSFGDSFYEYLLKSYIMDEKDDNALQMYKGTAKAISKHIITTTKLGNTYVKTIGDPPSKMEHLACFAGGMFALSSTNKNLFPDQHDRDYWLKMGKEVTHSCRLTYEKSKTQIGPDGSSFDGFDDGRASGSNSLLRPETVESYFYLYRITKDEKYRQWAWDLAVGLEKYAKTGSGYSGLRNINNINKSTSNLDGTQQSFLLAETFKYLYLIFCDDDVIPLNEYVFNTEAHPLKIIK